MAKHELTRVQAAGRPKWRKMYKGQLHYFRGTEQEALTQWHKKLVELEAGEQAPVSAPVRLDQLSKRTQWELTHLSGQNFERLVDIVENPLPTAHTLKQAREQFLARSKAKLEAGSISAGRFDTLDRCSKHFVSFLGTHKGVNQITGAVLEAYHTNLLAQKNWTKDYALCYLQIAKQFIRWLYSVELLDKLPRNLESKDLTITPDKKQIKTFTTEEMKTLLGNCSEKTKLYLLLMANIGATQKDLSDLQAKEVDWKAGIITRKRSKTSGNENTPTVSYPLWKETFALLRQFGNPNWIRSTMGSHLDGMTAPAHRLIIGRSLLAWGLPPYPSSHYLLST